MTATAKRTSKAWPANLNKRMSPELPTWNLGRVPTPDKPEEFQDFGRMAKAYFDECDRIVATEQERLLGALLEYLEVPPGDYKAGLLCLAERCVPAFKKAEKRGREPDWRSKLQLVTAVEREREAGAKTDTEALLRLYPEIKTQLELDNKQKRLAEARQWRDQMRSARL